MPRRSRTVLGIDPASCTGYALLKGRRRVCSGVVKMPNRRKAWREGERLVRFRAELSKALDDCYALSVPDYVALEWAHNMRSGPAMAMHGYIRNVVLEWCAERDLPLVKVYPLDVKHHATGRGNATKEQMVAKAQKRWRLEVATHDEADALFIADYGRNMEP